jgi:FdrA protein
LILSGILLAQKTQRRGGGEGETIRFARTLDETAELAVAIATADGGRQDGSRRNTQYALRNSQFTQSPIHPLSCAPSTLAAPWPTKRSLCSYRTTCPSVYSNAPLKGGLHLPNSHQSQGHTVVDLGEDEFTVGRLHPMLDNDLRIRRLHAEAADPETGLILLDVVLGDGAHPNPASELAPAIAQAIATARSAGRELPIVAVVIGTDADPQGLDSQIEQLTAAGAVVFTRHDEAVRAVGAALTADDDDGRRATDR